MLTRCPDCHTVYRVTPEQLQAAAGRVRCGQCGEEFDAQAEALASPVRRPETDSGAPADGRQVPERASAPPGDAADIPAALWDDLQPPPQPRRHGGWWVAAAVLLSLTLAAQYVYYMRARLAFDFPQLRPVLVRMCDVVRHVAPCSIPLPRDLNALEMLSSGVEAHPWRDGVLVVHATFVNTASHAQRYPLLEVRLADLQGTPIALRRFGPEEYLETATDAHAGMTPRVPVSISLEVVPPRADVSNFTLDFF